MTPEMFRAGPIYTVPFEGSVLTTNPQEVFHLYASTDSRVLIREIRLGQYTEFGDAQAELLSLTMYAGSTSASGGTEITPVNVQRHTGAPTAGTSCRGPSTTLSSSASHELVYSDSLNVAAGWFYNPPPPERITLNPGERFSLRLSAPADQLTLNGTLVFEEIGRP